MTQRAVLTTLIGCAVALAVSATACGDNRRSTGAASTTGTTAAAARQSMTLTGCLQKGDGRSDYILTDVNTTRTTVGTGGTAPAGSTDVGQEQLRLVTRTYRVDGDRNTLEPIVGRTVRVTGTMAERSNLSAHNDDGTLKDRDRTKPDEDDLARVKVASVDEVSERCGEPTAKP